MRAHLGIVIFLISVASPALAVPVEIIVHPDNTVTSISPAELSKIFLKRLRVWEDGQTAVAVDQVPSSAAREEFSRRVHGRSVVSIEIYWKRMIFSGKGVPPRELATDEEVLKFVRSNPGAVGYVTRATRLEGVKELSLEE